MKRTLIPRSFRDRFAVVAGLFLMVLFVAAIRNGEYWLAGLWAFGIAGAVFDAYILQDQKPLGELTPGSSLIRPMSSDFPFPFAVEFKAGGIYDQMSYLLWRG